MQNLNHDLSMALAMALDPVLFSSECLGLHPDNWQANVLRGGYKRLLLNCSRQSGKSTIASVMALHRSLYYPDFLVLLVSPSLRQSSEIFKKVTTFLHKLTVKPHLMEENKLSLQLENGSRIVSLPGSEGTVRGYSSVNLIIEDEAARVSDDLYRALRPMLAVSGGDIILSSTPFGKRGHFFREWEDGDDWERVKITAAECPRITKAFLDAEKKSLGERWFQQEYQSQFVENEENIFSHELIKEAIDGTIIPIPLL
jgi:hypothetical protein